MLSLRILDPAQDDISDALAVRDAVFGKEEGLLNGPDEDEYDHLHSTRHLVVNAGSRPVATARLVFPNGEVALRKGGHFGIALEELFDLSPLHVSGLSLVESGRVAVLREYRKRGVTGRLLAGIYAVSNHAAVDVWVAAANGETDAEDEALLMCEVAEARQLDAPWHVSARTPSSPPARPAQRFYRQQDWELARQGQLDQLPLPEVLTLFMLKMGARRMGAPQFLPEFSRWAFPISAVLREIPAPTLAWLKSLEPTAYRST